MGTISFGGRIKDNKETLDAENPNPLKPLTVEANKITPQKNMNSKIIECVGPEVLSFKEILLIILNSIGKKRLFLPFPLIAAKITARIFELMPNPLLTTDQLRLLKYDNIVSNNYATNASVGVPAKKNFENEIKKYSYMWRDGGQFSRDTSFD